MCTMTSIWSVHANVMRNDARLQPLTSGRGRQGNCGEQCATKFGFTREEQDAFATESYRRAAAAAKVPHACCAHNAYWG